MTPEDAHRITASWIEQAGIAAPPERIQDIAGALQAAHRYDSETGRHSIVDRDGAPMMGVQDGAFVDLDVVGYLRELTTHDARGTLPETQEIAKQPASTAPEFVRVTIGGNTSYRRADDAMVRISRGFDAAGAADIAKEAASWPNPWIKGKENRTRQQVILNTDPALAAMFKSQAGA